MYVSHSLITINNGALPELHNFSEKKKLKIKTSIAKCYDLKPWNDLKYIL